MSNLAQRSSTKQNKNPALSVHTIVGGQFICSPYTLLCIFATCCSKSLFRGLTICQRLKEVKGLRGIRTVLNLDLKVKGIVALIPCLWSHDFYFYKTGPIRPKLAWFSASVNPLALVQPSLMLKGRVPT